MKRVHAILHEPASYTVDRNKAIYDPLGITYSYMYSKSQAKSEIEQNFKGISELSTWTMVKSLWRILSDNDIVIMNGYTGKVFCWLFILNIYFDRVIGLDSDTPLNVPSNKLKRILKKFYLGIIFKNHNIYGLAGGSKSHKDLFSYYGMDPSHIFLMPMMVDNNKFITLKKPLPNRFRFLYVGRIVDVKNIPLMISAFINAFDNRPDVELRIVGTGNQLDTLKDKYFKNKNICFAGPKYGDELIEEYAHSNVLILPSYFEPWGLVVNEALSAGLPVIVSDKVGAAYDLVKQPNTGYVFKYDDIDDLTGKLELMVDDKSSYQNFSNNATMLMANIWNYDFYRKCLTNFIDTAGK